jgi:hypothetical protein
MARQIMVAKRPAPPTPQPVDRRTPSGRILPY